jgi:hypothetical protein
MDTKNMCDKERLVGYLYDEIDPASRRALEAHLASCAECRFEVGELRATRRQLADWAPPEQQLGFQIVRRAAADRGAQPAPVSRFRFSPVWGLAAAAVLVLAAAAAIANIEVKYGADGMTIRTGWGPTPVESQSAAAQSAAAQSAAAQSAAAQTPSSVVPADYTASLQTIERRLAQLESAKPQAEGAVMQTASGPRVSDADVLRRVRALLTDSETRQNRELALRIRQLATEMDAQRRVDLATIQEGLRGATAAEAQTHRQIWDYAQSLYRVSQQSQSK